MKHLFFLIALSTAFASYSQVGIGTNTPNKNAALEVSSTNKGILLPRVNDTTTVASPSEGLFIYNKQMKAPSFYNGTKWNSLAATSTLSTPLPDSITYTVTGSQSGSTNIANGTFASIISLSTSLENTYTVLAGGGGSGKVSFKGIAIQKVIDSNSVIFSRYVTLGQMNSNATIEFKMFAAGAATPYYSVKITQPYIISYDIGVSSNGAIVEQVLLSGQAYGFKNWVTSQSYSFNVTTLSIGSY